MSLWSPLRCGVGGECSEFRGWHKTENPFLPPVKIEFFGRIKRKEGDNLRRPMLSRHLQERKARGKISGEMIRPGAERS